MDIIATLQSNHATVPVTSIDKTLVVDWTKMNVDTLAHLVWHGLKQKVNDPNGAKDLSDAEKEGNSRKVLDALEANEVRMVSGRIADPVESELMKQARAIVCNKLVAKGLKLKDYKLADITKLAENMLTKYPDMATTLRANAEKTVADAKAAKELFGEIEL